MNKNEILKGLKKFGKDNGLALVTQCAGFGELVTGFIKGHMYINLSDNVLELAPKPEDAYQHCDILAVRVFDRDFDKANEVLYNWISKLPKVKINGYENGNEGLAREMCGSIDYVLEV